MWVALDVPLPDRPAPPPPPSWPAGARKVYAVEATDMAKFAKRLVTAQGLDGVVEVIQGVIESVDIPEKVDIIISEWMVRGDCGGARIRLAAGLVVSCSCSRGSSLSAAALSCWNNTPAPPLPAAPTSRPTRATSCCARACWTASSWRATSSSSLAARSTPPTPACSWHPSAATCGAHRGAGRQAWQQQQQQQQQQWSTPLAAGCAVALAAAQLRS